MSTTEATTVSATTIILPSDEVITNKLFNEFSQFYRENYETDGIVDIIKSKFTEETKDLTDLQRTMLAQYLMNDHTLYISHFDLAQFYLDQMVDINHYPVDRKFYTPNMFGLHASITENEEETKFLSKIMDHPCYIEYWDSNEYTTEYGATFMEQQLCQKAQGYELYDEIENKLKSRYPEKFARYTEYLEKCINDNVTFCSESGLELYDFRPPRDPEEEEAPNVPVWAETHTWDTVPSWYA